MNTQEPATLQNPHEAQSLGRFAGVVAVFLLLGPLLGALSVNIIFTLYTIGVEIAAGQFGDIGRLLWGGIVIGTIVMGIVAYAFGFLSALVVGLAVAFGDRRTGMISLKTATYAALLVWVVMSLAAISVVPSEGRVQWIGALFVAHLVAALACAALARRWFRARPVV